MAASGCVGGGFVDPVLELGGGLEIKADGVSPDEIGVCGGVEADEDWILAPWGNERS